MLFLASTTSFSDFMGDLLERIQIIWNMLINIVSSLLNAIMVMSTAITKLFSFSSLLPTFILTGVIVTITVAVIKFIIGR